MDLDELLGNINQEKCDVMRDAVFQKENKSTIDPSKEMEIKPFKETNK